MAVFYPTAASVFKVGSNSSLYGPDITGDPRGIKAIDIQTERDYANKVAAGYRSIAIGSRSKAVASNNISIGYNAISLGTLGMYGSLYGDAIAIGRSAYASKQNSVAIGKEAAATGDRAFAMGKGSKAYNASSFALGVGAIAGRTAYNDTGAVSVGSSTVAWGKGSVAIGAISRTFNNYALAIGYYTYCQVEAGVSIGSRVTVPPGYLVAIGSKNTYYGDLFDFRMTSAGVFSMMDWKVRRAPVAGIMTQTHTLSIDLNGVVYHVLLSDGTTP